MSRAGEDGGKAAAASPLRPTAVVVNDNRIQLKVLAKMVKQAGLEPLAFPSVEEAFAAMDPRHPPALIVTDVDMPGIDGWGFCRLLRSKEYAAFNAVPILVGSATFAGDEPARIAADLGAEAFVSFPVDAEPFVELVQAILRGERKRIPLRVLIVEDNPTMARLVKKVFSGEGYRADGAASLREAFAALGGAAYDLAVIDYHLSDGKGDALLERLRAEQPECACIMITGDPAPELALKWMKLGAAAHVHKPFEPGYLLELCVRARREQSLMRLPKLLEKSTEDLRRSEEHLRKAELRARTVLESVPEGLLAADLRTHRFVFANETFCRMLGYAREELLGLTPADILPAADLARVMAEFENMGRGAFRNGADFRIRRKDGSLLIADIRSGAVELDGRACVLAVFVDVTDRKRMESALRESQEVLSLFMRHSPVYAYIKEVTASRSRVLMASDNFRDMIGIPGSEMAGKTMEELFPPEFAAKMTADDLAVVTGGRVLRLEEELGGRHYATIKFPIIRGGRTLLAGYTLEVTEHKLAEEALQRRESYMRAIIENQPGLVWLKDADSRFLAVNTAFALACELRGPDQVVGKTDLDIWPRDLAERYRADDLRAMETAAGIMVEEIIYDQGKARWAETFKKPVVDDKGRILGTTGFSRDITERKWAEDKLKESEARFRSITENAFDMVSLLDLEGRYTYCNPSFHLSLGYEASELVGRRAVDLLHPEDRDRFQMLLPDGGRDRQAGQTFTARMVHKNGETRWVEHRARLIPHANRSAARLLLLATDVTGRKRLEEALDRRMMALVQPLDNPEGIEIEDLFNIGELQRLQDEFAQTNGVASVITRTDGSPITRPSRFTRFCDLIRRTEAGCANCFRSDAVIGRHCAEGPTTQPCLSGGLWDAGAGIAVGGRHIANWLIGQVRDETQSEAGIRAYARQIGADEEAVAEAFLDVPAMSKEQFGKIARMLFVFAGQLSHYAYQNVQQARFISDLKRAAEEKERLEGQLLQARKMESIGRLAGGVAHDFNNMLGVILGHAELALEGPLPDQALRDGLQEIRKAAERSADLTRQLLAFARKQTAVPKVLDLNETVEGMLKMLRRLIGEHIELDWRPGRDLGPVRVDPSQIDQILVNLCVNARDAIGESGKVSLATASAVLDEAACAGHEGVLPGEYVRLSVGDSGCGMDAQTLAQIFEPFFTTKPMGQGTGLGLATVYGIVKQNQGLIHVDSEPGQGTLFQIYLPRHEAKARPSPEEEGGKPAAPGHATILLVEDEPAILNMGRMMLERLGYAVRVAATPGEALRVAREHAGEIRLLMTDVVMPEMNGRDLAKRILSMHPGIRRLFMSGHTSDILARHGVLDEGVCFIQKPFSMKTLAGKIREALDGPGDAGPAGGG